jgi:catechol 2,3-dioxygenase-like lactoylglutathione lyase family enzyme
MTAPLIDHIGVLVDDLEQAIEQWSAVTGYTFSPIRRYRTERYVDASDPSQHHHDARIAFSLEGLPKIELMEVTGTGTHGPDERGVHHLAFRGVDDPEGELDRLAALGVGDDGRSIAEDGGLLLCFTRKQDLHGVRLELISTRPGPLVSDSGTPLPIDAATGRPDLWASID